MNPHTEVNSQNIFSYYCENYEAMGRPDWDEYKAMISLKKTESKPSTLGFSVQIPYPYQPMSKDKGGSVTTLKSGFGKIETPTPSLATFGSQVVETKIIAVTIKDLPPPTESYGKKHYQVLYTIGNSMAQCEIAYRVYETYEEAATTANELLKKGYVTERKPFVGSIKIQDNIEPRDCGDHRWEYIGHGHNYDVYRCRICGMEEDR